MFSKFHISTLILLSIFAGLITFASQTKVIGQEDIVRTTCNDDFILYRTKLNCNIVLNNNKVYQPPRDNILLGIGVGGQVLSWSNRCSLSLSSLRCGDIDTSKIGGGLYQLFFKIGNAQPVARGNINFMYPLNNGVNVTRWFQYNPLKTAQHYSSYMTSADINQLKSYGYDHVRLPLEVTDFYKNEATFDYLVDTVKLVVNSGMAIVVDAHSHSLNNKIETSLEERNKYKQFWIKLATKLQGIDSTKVFLQLYNEPIFINSSQLWSSYQMELYSAVRTVAPNNPIVLTGNKMSHLYSIRDIATPNDPNIIFDLHYYGNHGNVAFSHQGSTWSDDYYREVNGLMYPYQWNNCDEMVTKAKSARGKDQVRKYCEQRLNRAEIKKELDSVLNPYIAQKKKIWIGEFGVNNCLADNNPLINTRLKSSKISFITDVNSILREKGIPRALWGFDDCFGINARKNGNQFNFDSDYLKYLR